MIGKRQVAAARGLLNWSRQELADRADVSLRTIARFESGEGDITASKLERVENVLLDVGIAFVDGGVTLESLKRGRPGAP